MNENEDMDIDMMQEITEEQAKESLTEDIEEKSVDEKLRFLWEVIANCELRELLEDINAIK